VVEHCYAIEAGSPPTAPEGPAGPGSTPGKKPPSPGEQAL